MTILNIPTARVFKPLLKPSRYKGAWGGRGSGKSHFFAENLVIDHVVEKGLRSVCIREVQQTLKASAKLLIEDKIQRYAPNEGFRILNDSIITPGDGVILFQGMKDHTADSIKSLEGFGRAWIEEAQTLSARSLTLLRPTIRNKDSEIWASWNPRREVDPIDVLLRGDNVPSDSLVVKANWSDNPFFPDVLNEERLHDKEAFPDQYDHVWEGDYATIAAGAYWAKQLTECKANGRIGRVGRDPLMALRCWWDIGGTGAKSDAVSIFVGQFINKEIRILDHYSAQGQDMATHVAWLRAHGYEEAYCVLPHDGDTNDKVHDVSFESALISAGFQVKVIPNQGKGAASKRIEEVRRVFPQVWFNEDTTEGGRKSLGWYHEKKDESRDMGLGPDHDWSSHDADAFGLMAIDYSGVPPKRKDLNINTRYVV